MGLRLFKGFILLFLGLIGASTAYAGIWTNHRVVTIWGALEYRVFVPQTQSKTYNGLILALHGCKQSPEDFAQLTRLPQLAEREGLVLVFPKQSPLLNFDRCWNWFIPINQGRLTGEPAKIMKALHEVSQNLSFNPNHVFVVGMSAGAILANVLGSCYPEVFKGVALHSGIEYGASLAPRDLADGHMRCPKLTGTTSGSLAYACSGLNPKNLPPVILFHGDQDQRVYPCNSNSIFEQWIQMENNTGLPTSLSDAKKRTGTLPSDYTYVEREITNSSSWRLKQVSIHGLAHAWSGGAPGFFASDPKGPDATMLMWSFFNGKK